MVDAPSRKGVTVTSRELEELREHFSDLLNYEDASVLTPIDPLSYRTPEGDTCLHIAAVRGDTRAIELLLTLGADINAVGDMGYTALHYAAGEGHADAVRALLAAGASSSETNEFGKTAEDRARELGRTEIIGLFEASRGR